MMRTILIPFFIPFVLLTVPASTEVHGAGNRHAITVNTMLQDLRSVNVVFIGESHDRREHHDLQLRVIRSLQESSVPIAIGLEMFRKENQHILDTWTSGKLSERKFIQQYNANWRIPWPLYRSIFLYCRDNHIPLVALNIQKGIGDAVAKNGFESLSRKQRQALPPSVTCDIGPRYQAFIRKIYADHVPQSERKFVHFCEAQILWDQTMAWHIADYHKHNGDKLLIVLTGIGHAWRRGIPDHLSKYATLSSRIVLPLIPGEVDLNTVTAEDADYIVQSN